MYADPAQPPTTAGDELLLVPRCVKVMAWV